MSLEKYTKEELIAEISSRKKESSHSLYVGIIDSKGVESMILVEKIENLNLFSLQLRARMNSHRDPVVYAVRMPKKMGDILDKRIRGGEHEKVSRELESLSTFIDLGY